MASNLTATHFSSPKVTLLTVTFGGRDYRFSSYPVSIADPDGTVYIYNGGLSPITLSRSWQLASDAPTRTRISFPALYFPDDVALMIAKNHDLSAATAEVALWRPGLTHQERRVWLVGDVVNPQYGAHHEPVGLTVERQAYNDRGLTHDISARVTSKSYPSAPASTQERWYPIPIGYPGRLDSGTITRGSPALVIARDGSNNVTKILIADRDIAATSVYVFDESAAELLAVTQELDGNNRTVSVVDMTASVLDRTLDDYWIGFARAYGGGIYNRDRTAAMEGIGETLIWTLGLCTVPVDNGAWGSVEGSLNAMITVGGYIEEPGQPWAWAQKRLLPLVPVDVQAGPAGLRPILWKPARAEDAVAHLESVEGSGVDRLSPIEYTRTRDELANGMIVRYAIRADTTDPYGTVTIVPEPADDSAELTGAASVRSERRHHVAAIEKLESRWIWTQQSAMAWATWKLRDSSEIPRQVTYRAPLSMGWLLKGGQVVTVTDSRVYLSRQVARIAEASLTETAVVLKLILRRQLGRDRGQR